MVERRGLLLFTGLVMLLGVGPVELLILRFKEEFSLPEGRHNTFQLTVSSVSHTFFYLWWFATISTLVTTYLFFNFGAACPVLTHSTQHTHVNSMMLYTHIK